MAVQRRCGSVAVVAARRACAVDQQLSKMFSVEHFYFIQPDGKPLAEDAILPSPVMGYMYYSVYSTTGRLGVIRFEDNLRGGNGGTPLPVDGVSARNRWGHSIDAPLSVALVDSYILARGGSTRFGFGFANKNDGSPDASFDQAPGGGKNKHPSRPQREYEHSIRAARNRALEKRFLQFSPRFIILLKSFEDTVEVR
jgi:hypothetical protein